MYEKNNPAATAEQIAGLTSPVTIYRDARTTKGETVTLADLLTGMKDPKRKTQAVALRKAKESDPVAYKKLKDKLPGFSIGAFSQRKDDCCTEYAPLLAFDVDAAGGGQLSVATLEKAKKSPFVYAAFLTVSGQGVRIFMRSGSTLKTHRKYYEAGLKILTEVLEIPTSKQLSAALKDSGHSTTEVAKLLKQNEHLDCSTSNVSRLWYYTYLEENEIYVNEKAQALQLTITKATSSATVDQLDKITLCRDKVNRQAIPAGRNNYVHALACELAKFGVDEASALSECLKEAAADFNAAEITKTVESAFKRKTREYSDRQIAAYKGKTKGEVKSKGKKAPSDGDGGASTVTVNTGGKQIKFLAIKAYISENYKLRTNIVSHTVEAKKKSKEEWEELDENSLMCKLMEQGFTGVEIPVMRLIRSDFVPKYDPLKEYFRELPTWTETEPDYIEQLASFVVAKDQEWFNLQFKKMLVRMVACAMEVIPFNKQCFVIKSTQNDGKSSFVRFLCPPELREYMTDHIDIDSKDGRLTLCQNIIINLDELQGLSRTEINKTKALFTTDKVKERLPYDRKPTNHTRRASFFASTNEDEFLVDHTGNVRWLVFDVEKIRHDNGGVEGYNQQVDIAKVYAQAYALLRTGFPYNLTKSELKKSEDNNKAYQVSSSESELIPEYFTPAEKTTVGAVFMNTTAIHERLQEGRKTQLVRNKVGRALAALGYNKSTARVNGMPQKGYWVVET